MSSRYKLQIIDTHSNDTVVEWAPGGPVEIAFEDDLCSRVEAKGLSFRSPNDGTTLIREALDELILDLKKKV